MRRQKILVTGAIIASVLFCMIPSLRAEAETLSELPAAAEKGQTAEETAAEALAPSGSKDGAEPIKDPGSFERDYIQKTYDSDEGLDGSSVNCVFSDAEGLIWVGNYSGLYSYDSTEFHSYQLADYTVAIRCITQDADGTLWIGTNSDGVYYYDGQEFQSFPIDQAEPLVRTVYDIDIDEKGTLWAASGGGLLMSKETEEGESLVLVESVGTSALRDLELLPDGTVICLGRNGLLSSYRDGNAADITPRGLADGEKIRSVDVMDSGQILLGTDGSTILEIDASGSIMNKVSCEGIASINDIYQMSDGSAWVCADNGIAVLQGEAVTTVNLRMNNSVEMVCEDYQGNYWFASSRTGLLHLYENNFADLGNYLGITTTVNSVIIYQGLLYVGTDAGLLCYEGKDSVKSELIRQCEGIRIRQLLVDEEDNLWIATTHYGLFRQSPDGEILQISTDNSDLDTKDLRCLYMGKDGVLYIGSENGLYAMEQDGEVYRVVKSTDSVLNQERILCIEGDSEGVLYIGMDGDGLYVLKDGEVIEHKTMEDGLLSNVIMKIRTDETESGSWVVSGAGINHVSREGEVRKVTGLSSANCLDLIHVGDGEVVILARNGFFRLQESDLLDEKPGYQFYNKENGFVVDATSNANHCVDNRILYICGTDGLAALELDRPALHRGIRSYLYAVVADGIELEASDGSYQLAEDAYRLNIDVRLLNYCKDAYDVTYYLDGADHETATISSDDLTAVSYTNLKGKTYRYQLAILDAQTGQILNEKNVIIQKEESFWEDNNNRIALLLLIFGAASGLIFSYMRSREKIMERDIRRKITREKRREIERAAYQDLVTGVYNRNFYELEKTRHSVSEIKALAVIGIYNAEYLRKRNGIVYVESLLREAVRVLRMNMGDSGRIYRISEYIFCVSFKKKIDLEIFTQNIKYAFGISMENMGEDSTGLSVGAVYNDVYDDTYQSLFDRSDKMRRMDQEHEEDRFIKSKIMRVEQSIEEEQKS
ncbi:MAG: two-component regulator propeller domain-containing protein [Lachnospiraceae bacterium]|nr:two-component regulator propeller domain-containing protein [Lachnospiraceae bacterium]